MLQMCFHDCHCILLMTSCSCCCNVVVKLLCRDQSYPAPQITVARVTVTSARCCTQNLPLARGPHWASPCSDCNQEIREKKKNMRNTTSGIPPQEVGKYESFKHCSPNIRGDKETTRNWILILNLEHATRERIARTIQIGAETLVKKLPLIGI